MSGLMCAFELRKLALNYQYGNYDKKSFVGIFYLVSLHAIEQAVNRIFSLIFRISVRKRYYAKFIIYHSLRFKFRN